MCVTFFIMSTKYPHGLKFLIGFNRDERASRNTLKWGSFPQDPNIYAGRDQISGGTWLGINVFNGIMVFLTNFDSQLNPKGLSRGQLVLQLLKTSLITPQNEKKVDQIIENKLVKVLQRKQQYVPFNMVVVNIKSSSMYYICSQTEQKTPQILNCNTPYGMCNGHLQDLWPKTKHGLTLFQKLIQNLAKYSEQQIHSEMLKILKDNKTFSQSKEDQSSIFIPPYFSSEYQTERMTKTSFICSIYQRQDDLIAGVQQLTYGYKNQDSFIHHNMKII